MADLMTNSCLGSCSPVQVINFDSKTFNVDTIQTIKVCDDCGEEISSVEYAYSVDSSCWSCYMDIETLLKNIVSLNSDIYVRIRVAGVIGNVYVGCSETYDYSTQLDTCFNFTTYIGSANTFDPYANMSYAISLQQQLAETVSSMFGIPIYYFRLAPNVGSKDITFKEYTLMDVESVKQLKLIVAEGQMPSSKIEFADFGFEFQTDWEPEISKGAFATAFGPTAQPMEGDLIYIPMMQRMWMVSEAYDEKNGSLMWVSTTFKVYLSRYQEKGAVNLGDTEEFVNSIIKNKYEDLFGDEETLDSGETHTNAPLYAANNEYPVFESDAVRKYVTCNSINIDTMNKVYMRGTLISDSHYIFSNVGAIKSRISYQRPYCGDAGTVSFILNPNITASYEGDIFTIGKYFAISIKQEGMKSTLYSNKMPDKLSLTLDSTAIYLIVMRWSKQLNIIDFTAYAYTHAQDVPLYRLNNAYYYFDIEGKPYAQVITKYNNEFTITNKSEVAIHGFYGWITNIKLYDVYDDNVSEILQTYPNHQHLQINDTARKLIDNPGVSIR